MNCPKCNSVLYEVINGNLLCTKCQIQYKNPNNVVTQSQKTVAPPINNTPTVSPQTNNSNSETISQETYDRFLAKRKAQRKWRLVGLPLLLGSIDVILLALCIPKESVILIIILITLGCVVFGWLITGIIDVSKRICPSCGKATVRELGRRLIDIRTYNRTYTERDYIYQNGQKTDKYLLKDVTRKVTDKTYLIDCKCTNCNFTFVEKKIV